MNTMSAWIKSTRVGWIVFAFGLAWDIAYHTALFLAPVRVPDTLDLLGGMGHVLTLVGLVIVVWQTLRRHSTPS